MRRIRSIALNAACLTTGLLLGFGVDFARLREREIPPPDETSASTPAASLCPPPILTSPVLAQPSAPSLADIRAVIREELRTELAEHRPQTDKNREEVHPHDEKEEERQLLAYNQASQVVRSAIGYGTWTSEDRERFRSTLHELSVPQQDQVIGELFGAIQSGKLKVAGSGPPL